MYLSRRTYVESSADEYSTKEYQHNITKEQLPKNAQYVQPDKVKGVIEDVGYWRKANAIHNYFVNTCQDGVDDCRETLVSNEALDDLLDICKSILKAKESGMHSVELNNLIESSLPPVGGFFFGSTAIDEWYFKDLQHTVEIIETLDKGVWTDKEGKDHPYYLGDIYYSSSW